LRFGIAAGMGLLQRRSRLLGRDFEVNSAFSNAAICEAVRQMRFIRGRLSTALGTHRGAALHLRLLKRPQRSYLNHRFELVRAVSALRQNGFFGHGDFLGLAGPLLSTGRAPLNPKFLLFFGLTPRRGRIPSTQAIIAPAQGLRWRLHA
jgi:hypothetical protein